MNSYFLPCELIKKQSKEIYTRKDQKTLISTFQGFLIAMAKA